MEMEMPTPCTHCGEIFDLNDGCASDKWYRDTIICEKCSDEEQKEIEEDERWEDINIEVSNTLYSLDEEENIKNLLTKENQELIIKIVDNLKKKTNGIHGKHKGETPDGIYTQPNWAIIEKEEQDNLGIGL